jgi:rhamnosyltransferase
MGNKNLDILFVIVLYGIGLEQSATYLSLVNSLNGSEFKMDLLVYDNSPGITENYMNPDSKLNIIYIADKANSGVSKAYNTGAELATKMNKKWLLLLDQDTDFPVQTIEAYVSAISNYPDQKLFVPIMLTSANEIISPGYFKYMRGYYSKNIKPGLNSLIGYSAINCGMCVGLEAFKKNNGYNEAIKLDFSDHDFIRRFKKNITDKFVALDLVVKHQLSTSVRNSFNSDITRFEYYMIGSRHFSQSPADSIMLNIHAFLRALKLSVIHKNAAFLLTVLKYIFKTEK